MLDLLLYMFLSCVTRKNYVSLVVIAGVLMVVIAGVVMETKDIRHRSAGSRQQRYMHAHEEILSDDKKHHGQHSWHTVYARLWQFASDYSVYDVLSFCRFLLLTVK